MRASDFFRHLSFVILTRDSPTAMKQPLLAVDRVRRVLRAATRTPILVIDAVIVGDYGKGVVTQALLDELKKLCRARGIWLSLDPKPVHQLNLTGLSLITPNRKEAFELAGESDGAARAANPLVDAALMGVAE